MVYIIVINRTIVFLNRYKLILKCWKTDNRPSFKDITEEFGEVAGKYCEE